MAFTFEQGKDQIAKLTDYFRVNQAAFRAPAMKEAHIRQSLIDPFFIALGWDVANKEMAAPQYREVIPEESTDDEGHRKAPDYAFRIGQTPKFYAEAKKCGVNLKADPAPAYQLRRYAWSGKLPLSILTDFEELAVYDCRVRPSEKDKASKARIQYYTFPEYPDRWRDIWSVFSHEAIRTGSFDQFAESGRGKRGTSEVDSEFLKEIEEWRDALAHNMALRNPRLSTDDLNKAVQLTIDRIIFLRMAEDRGVEPYERLSKLASKEGVYSAFIKDVCHRADEKYNSGLFDFQTDRLTPPLAVDDKVLAPILSGLYFPSCPYEFRAMPVEILGSVYERFLGKVIRLTAGHQAKVEEKPEVRKAGGVKYTPSYIVDYIVKNTVGKWIEGKSPKQLAGGGKKRPFRLLDMACGSGTFLLGAYQCLLDHCLKWYIENDPTSHPKAVWRRSQGMGFGGSGLGKGEKGGAEKLSGIEGVAGGDGLGRSSLHSDAGIPRGGAIRPHEPDSESGRVDPGKHRGRIREDASGRLPASPLDGQGIADGDRDPSRNSGTAQVCHPRADGAGMGPLATSRQDADQTHRVPEGTPSPLPQTLTPRCDEWRLTIGEKKRILLAHIFGVDIDAQAVEVTKLSLLLKVLEGENDESLGKQMSLFPERALPNLDQNIRCGNSLIGPGYFTAAGDMFGKSRRPRREAERVPGMEAVGVPGTEEMKRVNPFDWRSEFPDAMNAGGFDCVIGNPPYIRIQTMKEWAPLEVEIYKELYRSAKAGNYDIYVVFAEKGLDLVNSGGRLGFILPHKFFNAKYGAALREIIAKGNHLSHVVHFGDQQVFDGVTTYTCLMFLDKAGAKECRFVKVQDLKAWRSTGAATEGQIESREVTGDEWNFVVGKGAALLAKLRRTPVKLGDVAEKIFQGLVTSCDPVYFLDPVGVQQGELIGVSSQATDKEYRLERAVVPPLCKGSRDIRRYAAHPSKRVLFPYDAKASAETGRTVLIPGRRFAEQFPRAWDYLEENSQVLRGREKGKMRHDGWYGYVYPKSVALFAERKILTPSIAARACYTLDREGELCFAGSGGGGGGGYGIILKRQCSMSYEYILGLLNSKTVDYHLRSISSSFRGGYYAYSKQYIVHLPIRAINFSDPADKARHDRMVSLVESMLALHKSLAGAKSEQEKRVLQRQIDATDAEIDRLVYELYELTEDEIKIVEQADEIA